MKFNPRLFLVVALLVASAVILQTVFIARLNLPGIGPDLLILAVVAVGLATSRNYGAVTGFVTGLLADVLPPDQTTLGVTAILLALVGYFAGSISDPRGMLPVQLFAILALLTVLTGAASVLMAAFVEGRIFDLEEAAWLVLAVAAYTSVLGVLIVPPLQRWLLRVQERLSRQPSSVEPVPSKSSLGTWRQ
ncbi:MAG: rod shape-determining protein MreD [Actinomycetia bacterium]|nr:rod shape-determining protein MreD [Actinomycetes bacterium]